MVDIMERTHEKFSSNKTWYCTHISSIYCNTLGILRAKIDGTVVFSRQVGKEVHVNPLHGNCASWIRGVRVFQSVGWVIKITTWRQRHRGIQLNRSSNIIDLFRKTNGNVSNNQCQPYCWWKKSSTTLALKKKSLVNHGINDQIYQPQLVSLPDFWLSTRWAAQLGVAQVRPGAVRNVPRWTGGTRDRVAVRRCAPRKCGSRQYLRNTNGYFKVRPAQSPIFEH